MEETMTNRLRAVNETSLRRLGSIVLASEPSETLLFTVPATYRGAFVANLYSLGFTVNVEGLKMLPSAHPDALGAVYEAVKSSVGADVSHEVMYPNFPHQVAEAEESELLFNALVHYVSSAEGHALLPKYEALARGHENMDPDVEVTVLGVAKEAELLTLARSILLSARPWSDVDKQDLENLSKYVREVLETDSAITSHMSVKENIATLLTLFPDADVSGAVKTVVDVLRVATALSDGDTSLAENTKFKLTRPQRRQVLSLLDGVVPADEVGWGLESAVNDASLHGERFKRLGRAVHHREHAERYEQASRFFDRVQKGQGRSVYSDVEKIIAFGDFDGLHAPAMNKYDVVKGLQKYPTIYARRLHEVITKRGQRAEQRNNIVYGFKEIAPKVAPAVLVQAWQLFSSADAAVLPQKLITVKNGNSVVIPNPVKTDSWDDVVDAIEFGLKRNHATSGWKDKIVHIVSDENNDSVADNVYTMPVSVRGVSSSDRVIGRGSRVKMAPHGAEGDVARLFMHWKNLDEGSGYYPTVDLDLSATFYSEDFTKTDSVWYGNLRSGSTEGVMSVHSGDIVNAPGGASEFVDVRVQAALEQGWRYVVPSVLSYTGQTFDIIPDAFAGVMMRDQLGYQGEIFEAQKVATKYDLTKPSTKSTPYLFDLKTRELIWLDASVRSSSSVPVVAVTESDEVFAETPESRMRSLINRGGNNVLTSANALKAAGATVVNTEYMSAYAYISHVAGAGRIVHDAEIAEEYYSAGFEVVPVRLDRAHELLQFLSAP